MHAETQRETDADPAAFEERAAICEHEGGLSRSEAEVLAALHTARLPGTISEDVRSVVIDAAARFLDAKSHVARQAQNFSIRGRTEQSRCVFAMPVTIEHDLCLCLATVSLKRSSDSSHPRAHVALGCV